MAYCIIMKFPWSQKLYYGLGNLGYSVISATLSNFIMFFGTSILGVSGTLIGVAVSISVVWDAVSDPIVGHYSDNLNSPLGKRHPLMLVGILGMAVANLIIWLIPVSASEGVKFVWILISLLSIQTFCTLFATPHLALGLDMTKDPHEQTSLQAVKTVFFLLGMMLPTVFMFIFMPSGNSQGQLIAKGYINISYVSSIICLVAGLITYLGTLKASMKRICEHNLVPGKKEKFTTVFSDIANILKKKNYRSIVVGYAVSLISSSVLTGAGLHMFTYCFHFNSQQISIVMGILLFGAILSQLIWGKISKKIGKKSALIKGLSVGIVAIILMWGVFVVRDLISTETLLWITLPIVLIAGFGTGVLYSFPISIFSDIMARDPELLGKNKYGTYSSITTLAYKLSNAFSLFIIGIMLDLIRFSSAYPVQPQSVQSGLGLLVILGMIISLGMSILLYSKYEND